MNGSLYNFLQLSESKQLTLVNIVQWAKDIARGKYWLECHSYVTVIAPADEAYYSFIDPVRMKG